MQVFEYQRLVAAAEGAGPDAAKRRGTVDSVPALRWSSIGWDDGGVSRSTATATATVSDGRDSGSSNSSQNTSSADVASSAATGSQKMELLLPGHKWVDAWRVDADGAATPEGWWYRANDTHDSSSSRRRLAAPWSRSLLALSSSFAATTTAATVTSGDGADNETVVAASVGAVRRRRWIRRSKKEATEVKLERPMNRMRMALLANQGSSPSSGGGGGGGGAVGIATPSTFSPPAVPQRLAGQQLPTTSMSSAGAATLGSGGG